MSDKDILTLHSHHLVSHSEREFSSVVNISCALWSEAVKSTQDNQAQLKMNSCSVPPVTVKASFWNSG